MPAVRPGGIRFFPVLPFEQLRDDENSAAPESESPLGTQGDNETLAPMTATVSQLYFGLQQLSATVRAEFLALITRPREAPSAEWTEEDASLVAAQTFARLDAEEEEHGGAHS